ncbi:MAG: APC family permease [Chloroflexota bacterium]|nr:APC family permease [Chloroflexota bacterium]
MSSNRPPAPRGEPERPRVDPNLEVREHRRGQRPGDSYVRIVRPFEEEFEHEGGRLVATERTMHGRTGWSSTMLGLRTFLIGRPISSEEEHSERLTKVKALAIFSSDNISSSAYGPEEILRVLSFAGAGALLLTLPIAALIIGMLMIVMLSYRQTIKAYPLGASSYLVASDNLGDRAGVTAAASLLIGYVVTVAVSVSAGVAALTSIEPALFDFRVVLGVALVGILALGNLRGIRESGSIFMAPTYLYIVLLLGIMGYALFRLASGSLPDYVSPPEWALEDGSSALGLFLILRAFSQGAVALTGVEAISDGVPAFQAPEWRNARTTLTWATIIFGVLFLGIAYLVTTLGIIPDPSEEQTVLSLLIRHVVGDGWLLVLAQVATALILVLAANTSFADFPRLSSFLARDGFMPRQFGFRGERLAFTTGILALSAMAVVLMITFGGSVAGLIPLYTLGVFVAFTLSQTGMLVRWWRRRELGWRRGLLINGLGAATTAVVAVVVGSSNFFQGSWMVIVLVPALMALLLGIRSHYRAMATQLKVDARADDDTVPDPIVIVPIARLDPPARRALAFARHISPDATGVHITNDPDSAAALRKDWEELGGPMELVVVESPYRALIGPLLRYMNALQAQAPDRPIVVVLSEIVPRHWWENLLHNQTSLRLKLRLFGRKNTIVADVPYHLHDE